MWESILEAAAQNSLWALMFVSLFVYQIKDGKARETKYQETIASLADKLEVVNVIKENVENIVEKISSVLDEDARK